MKKIIILLINICSYCIAAEIVKIHNIRIWPSPETIRIVFDLSRQVNYKILNLTNPNRVLIDFNNVKFSEKLVTDLNKATKIARIKQIRTKILQYNASIVFELEEPVIVNNFTLKPNERYGHRLILDLESNEKQKILALFDLDQSPKIEQRPKGWVIAIDAGHGGEDPGAIGRYGTQEKTVVLEIAKTLKEAINKTNDKKAFLIRNGDYYIGLKDRIARARQHHADLFISIHADAFANSKADGGSVFVLSEKGASSAAAKWLAEVANRSDTLGGIKFDYKNKDEELASVLLDLSQTANNMASFDAAKNILISLQKAVPIHKYHVETANFAVLKAPDVPSVLVEAGFISNPRTELKLKSQYYQNKIVNSILNGIEQYFLIKPKKV